MKTSKIKSSLNSNERNYEIPFFLFLTLILVGMYIWSVTGETGLSELWEYILFTILMILHIILYWISPFVFAHQRWLAPLLIIQGLIALVMCFQVQELGFIFGLYPGLVGLVIGMPTRRIWRVLAVGFYMVLSAFTYTMMHPEMPAFWWALGTVPTMLFVSMYVLMYLRQTEAREKAQSLLKDLEFANRLLREYAAQVEDLTIAAERQRMARELHDTLSQGLAGLILQLEAVDAHLAGNRPERARTIVRETMERARATLTDARRAIDDLRSTGTLGLGEAARREAESFMAATGIPCDVEISAPASLPDVVTEAAIRAIAEGLTNIARHARAKNAKLRIVNLLGENELEIEISDDGVGFNPGDVETGHYGLLGMRERIRLAGGRLEVHSELGTGTRLVIRFALEKQADD